MAICSSRERSLVASRCFVRKGRNNHQHQHFLPNTCVKPFESLFIRGAKNEVRLCRQHGFRGPLFVPGTATFRRGGPEEMIVTNIPGGGRFARRRTLDARHRFQSRRAKKCWFPFGSHSNVRDDALEKNRAACWNQPRRHRLSHLCLGHPQRRGAGHEPKSGELWGSVNDATNWATTSRRITSPASRKTVSMAGRGITSAITDPANDQAHRPVSGIMPSWPGRVIDRCNTTASHRKLFLDAGDVIRREVVAQFVALVDRAPQFPDLVSMASPTAFADARGIDAKAGAVGVVFHTSAPFFSSASSRRWNGNKRNQHFFCRRD